MMSSSVKVVLVSLVTLLVAVFAVSVVVPTVFAQPSSGTLIIVSKHAPGSSPITGGATVLVNGSGIGTGGSTGTSNFYSYTTNFNDTTVLTMLPGTYSMSVTPIAAVSYNLSADCFGSVYAGGTKTCTIEARSTAYSQVTVYVNVINNNGGTRTAGNFTVNVSGNSPSISSFAGSPSGTTFSLQSGSYSIDTAGDSLYAKTRSIDCSGTITTGDSRVCTITLDDVPTYTYPTGPYYLTCSPSRQSAYVGQSITFYATGGGGGYSWVTPNRSFINVGPSITVVQEVGSGLQSVIVSSGSQTATCLVDVIASGAPVPPPPPPPYTPTTPGLPYTGEGGDAAGAWTSIIALLTLMPAALYFGMRYTRRTIAGIRSAQI